MQGNFGEHLWWHGVCSTAFLPPLWQQNVVCEEGRHALVTHGGITGTGHKSYCIEGLLTTAIIYIYHWDWYSYLLTYHLLWYD